MIFQEMSLVPTLTVAQNVFLNREIKDSLGLIDDARRRARARELFQRAGRRHRPDCQWSPTFRAGQRS